MLFFSSNNGLHKVQHMVPWQKFRVLLQTEPGSGLKKKKMYLSESDSNAKAENRGNSCSSLAEGTLWEQFQEQILVSALVSFRCMKY